MMYRDLRGLPRCSMSMQCLRLLDDLDTTYEAPLSQQGYGISPGDLQEERLLERLRAHIPDCLTCQELLRQARQVRARQRIALRQYLLVAESSVPSTTEQIFEAVQQELQAPAPSRERWTDYALPIIEPSPERLNGHIRQTDALSLTLTSRHWLRKILALATVAALLLAAFGVFGHYFLRTKTGMSLGQKHWTSIMLSMTTISAAPGLAALTTLYNYDPEQNREQQLASPLPAGFAADVVSPDGGDLLYHVVQQNSTVYATLHSRAVFSTNDGTSGSAIWEDSEHFFVSSLTRGVQEVEIRGGRNGRIFPLVKTARLLTYASPYLYFVGRQGDNGQDVGLLYRFNTSRAGSTPEQVSQTPAGPGSNFLLSPDGAEVYYVRGEFAMDSGIYSIRSDGTQPGWVVSGEATPAGYAKAVGFASDRALLAVNSRNGVFQLIKYTPSGQQFQVLLNDIAPGAQRLCDPGMQALVCNDNVSVAPDGHALIVSAYYTDGAQRIWYDDLLNRKMANLLPVSLTPSQKTRVRIVGWNTMPLPSSPAASTTTALAHLPGPEATLPGESARRWFRPRVFAAA